MSAFITAFLDTWGIWAFIAAMVALSFFLLWANESHDPKPERDPAKIRKTRAELEDQRVATPLCTARWDLLHCDRSAWHAGQHAHTMPSGKVVTWPNLADCGGAA